MGVVCEETLFTDPFFALHHRRDKIFYQGIALTSAQEERVPYLSLFRKMMPQKFHAQHMQKKVRQLLSSAGDGNKRADEGLRLRQWAAITTLGNYRHAVNVSLAGDISDRRRVLQQWRTWQCDTDVPVLYWPIAIKEFMLWCLKSYPALFDTLNAATGFWQEYYDQTLRTAHKVRGALGSDPESIRRATELVASYLRATQTDASRLLKPVSYWDALLPTFRKPSIPITPDPELVVAIVEAYRDPELILDAAPVTNAEQAELQLLPECHRSKYLWQRRVCLALLQPAVAHRLLRAMRSYLLAGGEGATPLPLFSSADANQDSNEYSRVYCLAIAYYWYQTVYSIPLDPVATAAQRNATLHRAQGQEDVAVKTREFVVCPSCFAEHSLVCRFRRGAGTGIVAVATASSMATRPRRRKRKNNHQYTAHGVAGLSAVILDLREGVVTCGRSAGKKTFNCKKAPVCRFSLLGQVLCFRGSFYTLCTRPHCGMICEYDPLVVGSDELGPMCEVCWRKRKVSSSTSLTTTTAKRQRSEEAKESEPGSEPKKVKLEPVKKRVKKRKSVRGRQLAVKRVRPLAPQDTV
jgi:hypothetical protein